MTRWPDEEPDVDEPEAWPPVPLDVHLDAIRGLCSKCGQARHEEGYCPNVSGVPLRPDAAERLRARDRRAHFARKREEGR